MSEPGSKQIVFKSHIVLFAFLAITYLDSWPLVRMSLKLKLVIVQPILESLSSFCKFSKFVCIVDSLKNACINNMNMIIM